VPIFKAARNTAPSLNRLLITATPGGVEEVVRLIVSVADGEWRVGGVSDLTAVTVTPMATMMAMATPTMMTMWAVTWFVVTSWLYRW
jgi:hypothetical protein